MILAVIGGVAVVVGVATLLSHFGRSQPLVVPEVPQMPDRLVQAVNDSIWVCPYCTLQNDKDAVFCGRCGSPRKLLVMAA